ncbi:dihydroxy-acid dehydratase [Phytoactinopolyspora limicola]|uniref:dihydroxy-acid dehydratase n=1 Tax=Phytoactinopolyspora limicola TaxID=2715536 RepID=UPI00140D0C4A|nr:dihydroxy-acid dehydratase [Phytoactinopolyspora limicola]
MTSASGVGTDRPRRSRRWTAGTDETAMSHRVALRIGPAGQDQPVIGIADTSSALNPCHDGFAALLPHIERGIRDAGGIPARFPVMSLGEDLMKPSAMLYRNLVAMEIEETIRANPLDGVVLLANCDKSVPAAIMAAASANLPSVLVLGGARAAPEFRGRPLGSGTELWRALEDRRAGLLDDDHWARLERCLAGAGAGACNTMGTASTMAVIAEALGMCIPGSTGLPASGTDIEQIAYQAGRLVVRHVVDDVRPAALITQAAMDNAIRLVAAIGGSTNAPVHLAAIAGRLGLEAGLRRMDTLWRDVPMVVDVEPGGTRLIHDFRAAGGVAGLFRVLGSSLEPDVRAADGQPWSNHAAEIRVDEQVIRSPAEPVAPAPALAAVFGTLAPDGAVIKAAAASPELMAHSGPALVFDSYEVMRDRLDRDDLPVSADHVLVIRGAGPIGGPGMPEWGMAPIPRQLAEQGVRDMLRVSDARMSGTSFGTVVLHVAPESAAGGPLGLVRDGDRISFDLAQRRLDLDVPADELARRTPAAPPAAATAHRRGWPRLYREHVLQAPDGCDLDFLVAPGPGPEPFVEPVVGRS